MSSEDRMRMLERRISDLEDLIAQVDPQQANAGQHIYIPHATEHSKVTSNRAETNLQWSHAAVVDIYTPVIYPFHGKNMSNVAIDDWNDFSHFHAFTFDAGALDSGGLGFFYIDEDGAGATADLVLAYNDVDNDGDKSTDFPTHTIVTMSKQTSVEEDHSAWPFWAFQNETLTIDNTDGNFGLEAASGITLSDIAGRIITAGQSAWRDFFTGQLYVTTIFQDGAWKIPMRSLGAVCRDNSTTVGESGTMNYNVLPFRPPIKNLAPGTMYFYYTGGANETIQIVARLRNGDIYTGDIDFVDSAKTWTQSDGMTGNASAPSDLTRGTFGMAKDYANTDPVPNTFRWNLWAVFKVGNSKVIWKNFGAVSSLITEDT